MPLMVALIACVISSNCAKEVRKDFIADTNKGNTSCVSCHKDFGTQLSDDYPDIPMPELDIIVESRICIGGNDAYEKLAELTINKEHGDRNPHKSRLGDIDCVVCHRAHLRSKSYCTECHHNFVMPMPGSGD